MSSWQPPMSERVSSAVLGRPNLQLDYVRQVALQYRKYALAEEMVRSMSAEQACDVGERLNDLARNLVRNDPSTVGMVEYADDGAQAIFAAACWYGMLADQHFGVEVEA